MIRKYGFFGFLRLMKDRLYTWVFYNGSRLIRLPCYIRGSRYIDFGEQLTTGVNIRLDAFPNKPSKEKVIVFGKNIQVNDYVHIAAVEQVTIGDNVLIASKVLITDHNHGSYSGNDCSDPLAAPVKRALFCARVIIGKNVWIGEQVCILPGVTIGEGSIIGALSVVNRSIPAYSIAAGNPAKVIKVYDFSKKVWVATT